MDIRYILADILAVLMLLAVLVDVGVRSPAWLFGCRSCNAFVVQSL